MKYLALGISLLFIIGLSSCKKDWVCTCTYDDGVTGTVSVDVDILKASKSDAQEVCDAADVTWKLIEPNATCELK